MTPEIRTLALAVSHNLVSALFDRAKPTPDGEIAGFNFFHVPKLPPGVCGVLIDPENPAGAVFLKEAKTTARMVSVSTERLDGEVSEELIHEMGTRMALCLKRPNCFATAFPPAKKGARR